MDFSPFQSDAFGNLVSQTNSAVDSVFGFTGRQFDDDIGLQNNLNRWYDAQVGRWMSEDPIGFGGGDTNVSRYVGNSPTCNADAMGLAPNKAGTTNPSHVVNQARTLESQGLSRTAILERSRDQHTGNVNRYFYTDKYGWVDIRHFGEAANYANSHGSVITESLGFANEVAQWLTEWGDDYRSGFSPEDIPSNAAGAGFGDDYLSDNESLSDSLERWMKDNGARDQNDPKAGRDKLPATDPSERGGKCRGSSNPTSSNPAGGQATGGSN